MRKKPSPWAWTVAVSLVLSLLVGGLGFVLSRKVERISERPPGNRIDDGFREISRRITALEALWQVALERESERWMANRSREFPPIAAGIVQVSTLTHALNDPARAHRRLDGADPAMRPTLARFARGGAGEWVMDDSVVADGAGWLDHPGRPPAWRSGNGRQAVILIVDPLVAAAKVEQDLAKRADPAEWQVGSGFAGLQGPAGRRFLSAGTAPEGRRPDEILRHVSRFGDWTLERFYPVRVEIGYRLPVLAGSFSIASLLLGGGIAVASWQRKAIRLAEERVSFVNRVSHELRTPLTNLLLNTDLALDALPPEEPKLRRRLDLIREETARLARIVDNVLAFARIERGTERSGTRLCDLETLLAEMRENFAPLFARKSIVCNYHNAAGELEIDRDGVSQILSNLLSNVEKYAGDGARAQVLVSRDADTLVVDVNDDGPGVSTGCVRRIFLPFERAQSRVEEGASGTGLGLAISRELAARMGGSLELLPLDSGACFRLRIPINGGQPR